MAEFKEVMQQYKRMCRASNCGDCPLTVKLGWDCRPNTQVTEEDLNIWETTVMEWARRNHEPKRPTIGDMIYFIANEMNISILKPEGRDFFDFLNSELPEKVSNKLIGWLTNKGEK